MTEIELLKLKLQAYDTIADQFIAKVESGRARSVETYRALKQVRSMDVTVKRHKLIPTGDASRHVLVSERLKLRSEP